MRRRPLVVLAIVAVLVLAAAVLVGSGVLGGSTSGPEDYRSIANLDDFFQPQVIRVEPGSEVEWSNSGRNPHTVTADDGSFDSGVLQHGQDFSHTFTTPGVYRFTCLLHGKAGGIGMTGIVVVGDVPLPSKGGVAGVGPGREPVPTAHGGTIRVPADQPTIQAAVDGAKPGDLVLVSPGVYHEAVLVTTPYLTIRGTDRGSVILDGGAKLPNGIHVVEADGVAVENMTARRYALNGFYWSGVQGYRGSYLTAYANGDYGIYAFDSVWGRFEHSYASGSPDSGFYIGQCYPCHAVIDDIVSEGNALGYSGTNAGGDLWIVNSDWIGNGSGIAPNTLDSEALAPQRGITIAGNRVFDSGTRDVPTKRLEVPAKGLGIAVGGGRENLVEGNWVDGSTVYGIAVMPNVDANLWLTRSNVVRDNAVSRSGQADLVLGAPSVRGDCFRANAHATSLPPAIETVASCGARIGGGGDPAPTLSLLARFAQALGGNFVSPDWSAQPAPASDLPAMPDAATAPVVMAVPETAVPGPHVVRSLAETMQRHRIGARSPSREVLLMGLPLSSIASTLIGLYGYVFPLVLYAAWVAIALWDLVRREALTDRRRVGWMAVVLAIPLVGPVAYYGLGGSAIPAAVRWFLVVGGIVIYVAIAALAVVLTAA